MANTTVVNSTLSKTDGLNVKIGQGTAIDTGNTHIITPTGPLEEMIILITNTEASTNVVTVKAGDNPPAMSAGQGDLVLTANAATTGHIIVPPLESARFLQNDGTLHLTVEAGMTGFIQAIQLPQV